jgi:predicted O-linked N-acetylglucosamine transferase (SPINDLY family)
MNTRTDPALLVAQQVNSGNEMASLELRISSGLMTQAEVVTLAQNLEESKNLIAASNLYALWLNLSPTSGKHYVYYNFAAMLQAQKRFDEAQTAYEKCIELEENFSQAYINLGLLHEKQGRSTQALGVWVSFVSRCQEAGTPDKKHMAMALNHIGRVQENLRNYAQAEKALEDSLNLDPEQPGVIQHWVHIRQKSCVWPIYKALPGVSTETMHKYTSPLAMLAITNDPAEQLENSRNFVERTYTFKQERMYDGRIYQHQKVRIAYVSGDFREHAVGFLLPTFLDGHDRDTYELYAYDFSRDEKTQLRASLLSKFDHHRSISDLSDRAAAELILKDEIDILVDLHGLSSGARPGIFAYRPAPKQGTYLGFIGPTSMPWFDFVIADKEVLPPELAGHFTEKPIYLNTSFIPLISYQEQRPKPQRKALGLPEDGFIMGAFSNTYKITPEVFDVWMRLLKRIPKAYLWLIDDNDFTTENLKKEANKRGIASDRLIFMPRTTHLEFCARLTLADVFLDTFPYNCGSTTNDIVNANVPFVSRYGKTMVSRMGLSVLTTVGAQSNAVTDFAEYEKKVVEFYVHKNAGLVGYRYGEGDSFNLKTAFDQLAKNSIITIFKKINLYGFFTSIKKLLVECQKSKPLKNIYKLKAIVKANSGLRYLDR